MDVQQGWATLMMERATFFLSRYQRAAQDRALPLIGYEKATILNKTKIRVYTCLLNNHSMMAQYSRPTLSATTVSRTWLSLNETLVASPAGAQ